MYVFLPYKIIYFPAITRYLSAVALLIRLPQITIGTIVKVIAKLMNPHAMNMFCAPDRDSHGLIAKGMPILMAFRMKATPVKASPVICSG